MEKKLRLGVAYPLQINHHTRQDLINIKNSNINSILFAVSEDQLKYNLQGVIDTLNEAKKHFEYVSLDFWAMGGIFGGEASSNFIQLFPEESQKFNKQNTSEGAVCPQSKLFLEYFFNLIKTMIKSTKIDEIFIDEPHWPTRRDENRKIDENTYSCFCKICKHDYFVKFKHEMPITKNDINWNNFIKYRQDVMLNFLKKIVSEVKKYKNIDTKDVNVNVCIHPKNNWIYGSPNIEDITKIKEVDIISIDPYHFKFNENEGYKYVKIQIENAQKISEKYKKSLQVWVQGFKVPKNRESEINKIIHLIHNEGICDIQFWSYGNCAFSSIISDNPNKTWLELTKTYEELLK